MSSVYEVKRQPRAALGKSLHTTTLHHHSLDTLSRHHHALSLPPLSLHHHSPTHHVLSLPPLSLHHRSLDTTTLSTLSLSNHSLSPAPQCLHVSSRRGCPRGRARWLCCCCCGPATTLSTPPLTHFHRVAAWLGGLCSIARVLSKVAMFSQTSAEGPAVDVIWLGDLPLPSSASTKMETSSESSSPISSSRPRRHGRPTRRGGAALPTKGGGVNHFTSHRRFADPGGAELQECGP